MSYRPKSSACSGYRPRPKAPVCTPGYSVELGNFDQQGLTVQPANVISRLTFPAAATHLPPTEAAEPWVEADGSEGGFTGIRIQKAGLYQLNTSVLVEVTDARVEAIGPIVTEVVAAPSINGAPLSANRPYRIRGDYRTRVGETDTTFVQTLNGSVTVQLERGDLVEALLGSEVDSNEITLTYASQLLSVGRLSDAGRRTLFIAE